MSILVKVKSHDPAIEQERRKIAESVIREFGDGLPDLKLLAFFDDQDSEALKREFGRTNRGLYKPLKPWPGWTNKRMVSPASVCPSGCFCC